jgi:hypothetical protein
MIDLEVDLAPELTKASRSSASTSAYFQATHVITTRDALEEFVVVDIWPCKPRWGPWAFKMKKLPRLDFETRSPKFNAKRPEGKTDEEIVAEVEKKVIQMISNYTHKEWECAQNILKHQGRVNRVFEEMEVSCPPRPKPAAPGRKCNPLGTLGPSQWKHPREAKWARLQLRQRAHQKLQKPLMSWRSGKLKMLRPPSLQLRRNPLN